MNWFEIVLIISILLSSLVAGLVFAFAVIVMPGIGGMEDRDFLRTFKVMDKIIQDNQPLFMLVWVGSALMVIVIGIASLWYLDGVNRVIAVVFAALYILGVHLPTILVNIPLNDKLQTLDLEAMSIEELVRARTAFEPSWNLWNSIRTVVASISILGLIVLATRL